MTLRFALPWMAAAYLMMLVSMASPAAGAQGDDGIANNPASVTPPQTLQQPLASSGDIETTSAIRADTAPDDVQLPARESAPLGRPNGILGARPQRDPTQQEEGKLAAFDPRTNSGLRLNENSVIELDKAAGDPVDIFVNDRHVARGEVLVLNENFCVRISEIIQPAKAEE